MYLPSSPSSQCVSWSSLREGALHIIVCMLGVSIRRSGGRVTERGGWRVLLSTRLNGSFVPRPQWGEGQGSDQHPVIMFLKTQCRREGEGELDCSSITSFTFSSDLSFKVVQFMSNTEEGKFVAGPSACLHSGWCELASKLQMIVFIISSSVLFLINCLVFEMSEKRWQMSKRYLMYKDI